MYNALIIYVFIHMRVINNNHNQGKNQVETLTLYNPHINHYGTNKN